jgi:hypothetical protein
MGTGEVALTKRCHTSSLCTLDMNKKHTQNCGTMVVICWLPKGRGGIDQEVHCHPLLLLKFSGFLDAMKESFLLEVPFLVHGGEEFVWEVCGNTHRHVGTCWPGARATRCLCPTYTLP